MIRRALGFCLACAVLLADVTRASAAFTFRDDFSACQNTAESTYAGITPRTVGEEAPLTFGGFASAASAEQGYIASASYQLEGARTIRLGIYTIRGTFVQEDPQFGWALGVGSLLREQDTLIQAPQAKLGTGPDGRRGVYAVIEGAYRQLYWDEHAGYYTFREANPPAQPANLVDYGVSVRADGKAIPLTRTAITYYKSYRRCYEEFTASLPTGTRAVTVEANDAAWYPNHPTGESITLVAYTGGIAFVELTGERILPQEPIQSEEDTAKPPASSSTPEKAGSAKPPAQSAKPESSRPSTKPEAEASKYMAPASSAKVEVKQKESSAAEKPAAVPKAASGKKFEGSSLPPLEEEEVPKAEAVFQPQTASVEPMVYKTEIPRREKPVYLTGAAVYVALALAALLAVILKGGKAGK